MLPGAVGTAVCVPIRRCDASHKVVDRDGVNAAIEYTGRHYVTYFAHLLEESFLRGGMRIARGKCVFRYRARLC